jgi:hypothetical protein
MSSVCGNHAMPEYQLSYSFVPSVRQKDRGGCDMACTALHCIAQVAAEGGALTLGGISKCPSYLSGMTKADVQKEFKNQIDVFVSEKMDFLLCEVRIGTDDI